MTEGSPCCQTASGTSITKHPRESSRQSFDSRLRNFFVRTNLDIILIAIILASYHASYTAYASETGDESHGQSAETNGASHSTAQEEGHTTEKMEHEEVEETYAILFPWFCEIIGVFVYYVLSRYAHGLPYTAIMFLVGFAIGFSVQRSNNHANAITESASLWIGINGEIILLVFLPGLLYLDSYNIDVHLFVQSFVQLMIFAFPMVLAGTALTALVAYYIFPYGWSFDLCMTFGSILSATDPVAVAILLNELGAPPRLKMHISGESLLNDGSAVVFYNIFSARFYYQLGLDGVGELIGWGKGFELFFRLSLGGVCIGVAFGIGTVFILYSLKRRLSGEDSVVQVVTTITAAYLVFFTSEILAKCSGIIAVMFCGLTVKAFGETLVNHTHLMHHFWEITEYLLNTLLFALAGCVWGDIISNNSSIMQDTSDGFTSAFNGEDWGYLILLFVLVTAIRFFLVFAFFPITSRIGIGTNWKESFFMAYGGLRGAVGIALSLSLHAEVVHFTSSDLVDEQTRIQYRIYSAKVFAMVGGIALLTLVVNGTTSGPLLKKLGLVTPSATRKKVIENYRHHMIQHTLVEYVNLLCFERFKNVDFTIVKDHVPFLRDITYDQLRTAVRKHKENTPAHIHRKPNLKNIVPYLYGNQNNADDDLEVPQSFTNVRRSQMLKTRRSSVVGIVKKNRRNRETLYDMAVPVKREEVNEERLIFIHILRQSYHHLIHEGELESRGFMPYSFFVSLDFAADAAEKGHPLNDWDALQASSISWVRPAEKMLHSIFHLKEILTGKLKLKRDLDKDFLVISLQVKQATTFIRAHERSIRIFKEEFSALGKDSLTAAEKEVLDESRMQISQADSAVNELDSTDVAMITSHYACQILLNKSAHYFSELAEQGLMTAKEAGELLEEIEEDIMRLSRCRQVVHKDELRDTAKLQRLRSVPKHMVQDMSIQEEDEEGLSDEFVENKRSLGAVTREAPNVAV